MRHTPLILSAALGLSLLFNSAAPAAGVVSRQLSQRVPELRFQGVTLSDAIDFLRDVSGANITVNWKALEGAGVSRDTPVNIHLRAVSMRKALDLLLSQAGGGDQLTFDVDQGVIEVTTREIADHRMVTRVYPVEDLIMIIPDFTDAPQFNLDASQNQSGGGGGGGGGSGGGGSGGGQTTIANSLFQGQGQTGQNQEQIKTKAERAQDLVDLIQNLVFPDIWKDNGGTASIRYFNGSLVVTAPRSVQEAIGGDYD
jgi:hypothetical protein